MCYPSSQWVTVSPKCHHKVPPLPVGVEPDIPEEEESGLFQQWALRYSAGMCMYCHYMHTHFLTYLVICVRWSSFLCSDKDFRGLNVSLGHLWSFVDSSLKALYGEGHFLPGYNFIVFSNSGSGTIRVFQLKNPTQIQGRAALSVGL